MKRGIIEVVGGLMLASGGLWGAFYLVYKVMGFGLGCWYTIPTFLAIAVIGVCMVLGGIGTLLDGIGNILE